MHSFQLILSQIFPQWEMEGKSHSREIIKKKVILTVKKVQCKIRLQSYFTFCPV